MGGWSQADHLPGVVPHPRHPCVGSTGRVPGRYSGMMDEQDVPRLARKTLLSSGARECLPRHPSLLRQYAHL